MNSCFYIDYGFRGGHFKGNKRIWYKFCSISIFVTWRLWYIDRLSSCFFLVFVLLQDDMLVVFVLILNWPNSMSKTSWILWYPGGKLFNLQLFFFSKFVRIQRNSNLRTVYKTRANDILFSSEYNKRREQ